MPEIFTSEPFEYVAGGLDLVGERWDGDPDRATVVLLHGGGQTRHSWRHTAARLAAGGRSVVALDARGHGDSQWDPAGDYLLDAFVADLSTYLESSERSAVLVGASLGGMIALVTAAEHPEWVAGLVLVDVVLELEREGVEKIRRFMGSYPNGFSSLDEVADAVAAYNPHRERPRNLDGLRKNVRLGDDGRWRWHWDPAFVDLGDEPQRRSDPKRLRRAAEEVRAPTLIVRGADSDVVSQAGLDDMARMMPDAEFAEVGAAGHMVAGDDNDVFGDALEHYLEQIS
ncbi:MAG: alpha/beta hydrolase [Thermoleophilia bacterium]|nr:alpha/beta hydrolase [Thermoleophilia bacterium]